MINGNAFCVLACLRTRPPTPQEVSRQSGKARRHQNCTRGLRHGIAGNRAAIHPKGKRVLQVSQPGARWLSALVKVKRSGIVQYLVPIGDLNRIAACARNGTAITKYVLPSSSCGHAEQVNAISDEVRPTAAVCVSCSRTAPGSPSL
jgi:hypothetical protein